MTGGGSPPSRKPATYEIRIRGRLDEDWVEWFDDMTLTHTGKGDTLLAGPVPDQAALHGLLNKIRNLNLDLISVTQVGANARNTSPPGEGAAHAE
ncbi:hypothetical protein ACFLWA_00550 [Chloroflexota bacterium]